MASFKPELRHLSMTKRAKNRKRGKSELFMVGLPFESKNGGAHLIINPGKPDLVDFWPGTGLWKETGGEATGRGLDSLFAHLRVSPSTQAMPLAR